MYKEKSSNYALHNLYHTLHSLTTPSAKTLKQRWAKNADYA